MLKKYFLLASIIIFASSYCESLLIIDTSFESKNNRTQLINRCNQAGFTTDYIHHYELKTKSLNRYDTLLLLIDPYFIAYPNHWLIKNSLESITNFTQNKNKKIILALPRMPDKPIYQKKLTTLLQKIGIVPSWTETWLLTIKSFFYEQPLPEQKEDINKALHYLFSPLTRFSQEYDTSLKPKNDEKTALILPVFKFPNITAVGKFEELFLGFNITLPHNNYLLTRSDFLLCDELQENFWFIPSEKKIRNSLLEAVTNMFAQFNSNKNEIKKENSSISHSQKSSRGAWLDFESVASGDQTSEKLIVYLYKARIDWAWIRFNPERYLSDRAIYKNKQNEFKKQCENFSKQWQEQQKKYNHKIDLYIGFELTTNFEKIKPKNHVVDLYGNHYPNIPNPFDIDHFWQPEFIEPLQRFVEIADLTIDGIWLDLEMYHAPKQAGEYTNYMDFSPFSWKKFVKEINKPEWKNIKQASDMLKKLIDNNVVEDYFAFLQQQAFVIGSYVQEQIAKIVPHARIGIYNMTLPHSWFSIGFLQGVSKQEPILLATFNVEWQKHKQWIREQKINALHHSAFLLSRLRDKNDIAATQEILSEHDGIWYNRFNRLTDKYEPGIWWEVERSPLPADQAIEMIKNNY